MRWHSLVSRPGVSFPGACRFVAEPIIPQAFVHDIFVVLGTFVGLAFLVSE